MIAQHPWIATALGGLIALAVIWLVAALRSVIREADDYDAGPAPSDQGDGA